MVCMCCIVLWYVCVVLCYGMYVVVLCYGMYVLYCVMVCMCFL